MGLTGTDLLTAPTDIGAKWSNGFMTLADLKRKPIVSMSDGMKLGDVEDLVLDVAQWSIPELCVAAKGGHGILPLPKVKSIGPDAVTVESPEMVDWNAKPSGRPFGAIKDLQVVDGGGNVLGHPVDLRYDGAGAIECLEVHKGGVLGLGAQVTVITPAQVRGVGDRLITVELATE